MSRRLIFAMTAVAALAALAASLPASAADKSGRPTTTLPGVPSGPPVILIPPPTLKSLSAPSGGAKVPLQFTLTDDGKNKSCVVAIDWGDASATPAEGAYTVAGFPATLTHTYAKGGLFQAKVKGVKTCVGEVSTTAKVAEVNQQPAPNYPVTSSLGSVGVLPAPLMVGQSGTVTVKLAGNTASCIIDLDFGDGLTSNGAHINNGDLTLQRTKTYTAAGTYIVKAHGKQSCAGDVQTTVVVNAPAVGQQGSGNVPWNGNTPKPITIQGVTVVTPPPYTLGQVVQWKITGVDGAACGIGLSQGNQTFSNQMAPANSPQAASANVLDKLISFNLKAGFNTFSVQPDPIAAVPCLGGAQATIQVQ